MIRLVTTRTGAEEEVDVAEDALLEFPEGLPGFEEQTLFALIEDEAHPPLRWLQSVQEPSVRFLVVDPTLILPEYQFDINEQDSAALKLQPTDLPEFVCVLVVPDDFQATTANLKAPVVMNRRARLGKQLILTDERYDLRYPVFRQASGAAVER